MWLSLCTHPDGLVAPPWTRPHLPPLPVHIISTHYTLATTFTKYSVLLAKLTGIIDHVTCENTNSSLALGHCPFFFFFFFFYSHGALPWLLLIFKLYCGRGWLRHSLCAVSNSTGSIVPNNSSLYCLRLVFIMAWSSYYPPRKAWQPF